MEEQHPELLQENPPDAPTDPPAALSKDTPSKEYHKALTNDSHTQKNEPMDTPHTIIEEELCGANKEIKAL